MKLLFAEDGYSEVTTSLTTHRYFGNEHGKLDKAVSVGAVFTRRFDDLGFLLMFTDACGATTSWERDLRGRETKMVDALGGTTAITRDADGNIREIVEPGGGVTTVERQPGTMLWRDPIGATFEVRYDARGLVERTIAPNGDLTQYRYDEEANLTEIINAQGGTSRASYDAWGRCTSVTDASGATTRYVYSHGGRVLAVIAPDGSRVGYDYDDAGRVVAVSDPRGRTTMAYGGLDRLCEVVAPNGERVSLRYDREGRLSTVINARGEIHRFVRRRDGLVIEERTFDGRTFQTKHDAMGRVIETLNGENQKVVIERDVLGRMVKRTTGNGLEESFDHNARGDILRAASGDVEVIFERNALGWIVREDQHVGTETVTVENEYDLMGRVARRTTSRGHSLVWERKGNEARVTFDGREQIDVRFDAVGREVSRHLAQGGRIESAYDATGRLSSRRVLDLTRAPRVGAGEPDWVGAAPGAVTVEQRYAYSAALLSERWDLEIGLTRLDHDPLGRLLSIVPERARAELFHYGSGGNLTEAVASSRTYAAGGRIVRKKNIEYVWDRAGRVVETLGPNKSWARYSWSAAGHLLAVEKSDGVRIDFLYDAFCRRLEKRASCNEHGARRVLSSTRFVWDATTLVHEIKTSFSDLGDPIVEERTFCFEEKRTVPWAHRDVRIAGDERKELGWFHYLNDDSGAPERLVDGRGNVACTLRWTAWGHAEAAPGGSTSTPFRFRGQYADEETGLSYNRHRYDDPSTGRYLSADPIGLLGGLDPFAYAGNCPTSAVDVEGLMYTIIKKGKEKVVDGENLGAGGSVTAWDKSLEGRAKEKNYRPSCSESTAVNELAKKIRRENSGFNNAQVHAETKRRFTEEGYTIETYEGNREDYEKSSKKDRVIVNPCELCGAMLKDLGIQDSVLAANKQQGAKRSPEPWDKKSHYKPGRKR